MGESSGDEQIDEPLDDEQFEWDENNENRLLLEHNVRAEEVEELFYGGPDVRRYGSAYLARGKTYGGRWLFVVFVRRNGRIRAYSARDLTENEKKRMRR